MQMSTSVLMVVPRDLVLSFSNLQMMLAMPSSNSMVMTGKDVLWKSARIDLLVLAQAQDLVVVVDSVVAVEALVEDLEPEVDSVLVVDLEEALEVAVADLEEVLVVMEEALEVDLMPVLEPLLHHQTRSPTLQPLEPIEARSSTSAT